MINQIHPLYHPSEGKLAATFEKNLKFINLCQCNHACMHKDAYFGEIGNKYIQKTVAIN